MKKLLVSFCLLFVCAIAQGGSQYTINSGQFSRAVAVTKSDTAKIDVTNGLYVGVSGDIFVDLSGVGTNIKFKAVPVGVLPIRVTRVYSTGTTATDIVALRN